MYRCIQKDRDKNGVIVAYTLRDLDSGNNVLVSPIELKNKLASKSVGVTNLTLTSDGRLVDHDDSAYIQNRMKIKKQADDRRNLIIKGYTNNNNGGQVNYALRKTQSKRVGKLVTRALVIGLTCASLATLTGCGSAPVEANAAGIEQVQDQEQKLTLQDKIDKLNEATDISVDVHNFSINKKADISVDGTEIGTISGKFVKIFDTLTFKDSEDETISVGDQNLHLMFDNWTVYDSEGNALYTMKENFTLKLKKYTIMDAEGNEVAWLRADFALLSKSAHIYDMDDNVIADLDQAPFRKDFTIRIKEGCKIDNVSITTISVNYMMQRLEEAEKERDAERDARREERRQESNR